MRQVCVNIQVLSLHRLQLGRGCHDYEPDVSRQPSKPRHYSSFRTNGNQSGLLTDSVVMTHNLGTIAKSEIERNIGVLPMKYIDSALRHTLAL